MTDEAVTERGAVPRFIVVLEHDWGYAAHTRNLERAVRAERDLDVRVIRVGRDDSSRRRPLPGLGTWSFRASVETRSGLRRRLSRRGVDAVYIHSQVASLLAVDLMRHVPTVISLDATPRNYDEVGDAYGHRRQGRTVEWLKWAINRRAFDAARALVPWSQWVADSLVDDYGVTRDKVTLIRPGVDLSRFRPPPRGRPRGGPVRILFVGHDFHREGGDDLLRAMVEPGLPAELDIVTSSSVVLPSGVRGSVHTGIEPLSQSLVDLFQRADLLALPTRGETYPQVIAQAMACGLPVVATRVGAIPEVVHSGVNGLLVFPGDVGELATALRTLATDAGLRRRMGESGLRLAQRDHDARANNAAIFALMRRLAGWSPSAMGSRLGVKTPSCSVVEVIP